MIQNKVNFKAAICLIIMAIMLFFPHNAYALSNAEFCKKMCNIENCVDTISRVSSKCSTSEQFKNIVKDIEKTDGTTQQWYYYEKTSILQQFYIPQGDYNKLDYANFNINDLLKSKDNSTSIDSNKQNDKVYAVDKNYDHFDTLCADSAKTLSLIGLIIYIVKLVIPLIIIVKSTYNLFFAVAGGKPQDEIKKFLNKLIWSLIAGVLIFMLPVIVNAAFNLVDGIDKARNDNKDYVICEKCLFDPKSEICQNHIEEGD